MGYDAQPLASRGSRFAAKLVDGLLDSVLMMPGMVWFIILLMQKPTFTHPGPRPPTAMDMIDSSTMPALGLMALPVLGLAVYQWYLISTTGQTLGKKWLKIRIMKTDGRPVDFVSGVLLRNWVLALLANIPYIGGCIGLVDALMIFGSEQQCLHDKIASTKVVAVLPNM